MNHKKMKFLSLLLALLMIVPSVTPGLTFETSAASVDSWNDDAATAFAGGNGTSSNPYKIANGAQLAYLARLINYEPGVLPDTLAGYNAWTKYRFAYYVLIADIDLGNREWNPIGGVSYLSETRYYDANGKGTTASKALDSTGALVSGYSSNTIDYRFRGSFDGNGYTISNMTISQAKPVGTGLFGITQNAKIKNFTLSGKVTAVAVDSPSSQNNIPGASMLMTAAYSSTVSNVTVFTDMKLNYSMNVSSLNIGSICGYATGSTFTDCNLYGSIETKISSSALLLGSVAGKARGCTFKNIKSDVDIYARDLASGVNVGGLIGQIYSNSTVTKDSAGNVTAIGTPEHTYVYGCAYSGDIHAHIGKGTLRVGGIVGVLGNPTATDHTTGGITEVSNCFVDGNLYTSAVEQSGTTIYRAPLAGLVRATQLTIRNFFTSSNEDLYNLDTQNYTYITSADKGSDYNYQTGSLVLDDEGGHIKGVSIGSPYGVAVRMTYGSTGLRYNSTIKRTLYDSLVAHDDVTFTLGTIITPTDYVDAAGAFTVPALDALKAQHSLSTAYLDVKFVPGTNGWLDAYYSDNTVHYFSGAISGIKSQNYNRSFSGVGYVKIESEGYSYTFCGDYTDAARARTVAYVAMRADTDRSTTQVNEYQYLTPDGDYSPYSQRHLENISNYVANYDATKMNTADLSLMSNGKSKYVIVCPYAATESERVLAAYLQHVIYNLTGVTLEIRENVPSIKASETEIMVGCYDRAGDYYVNSANLDGEYSVMTAGKRILILGGSDKALSSAIHAFVKKVFGVNLATSTKLTKTANATVTVPRFLNLTGTNTTTLTNSLSGYTIHYDHVNEIQSRMAYRFQQDYLALTGEKLAMTTASESGLSGNYVRWGGSTSYTGGEWKITNTNGLIGITAGSYYGFEGAKQYLLAELKFGMAPITTSGFTASGKYQGWADGYEEVSKYAYDKQGTARVMHYNVLWGDSSSSGSTETGNYKEYTYPIDIRNTLRTEMVKQYMPDVLGLQEMSAVMRGGVSDGSGGFIEKLAALGYVEAIDPRVNNAYAETETIPGTDATLTDPDATTGSLINGYGISGATQVKVTANGKYVNYTYYNCTPLLYNAATTTCVASGYYWYKSQTDYFYRDVYTTANGNKDGYHGNSSNDAASKSASWGVFETDGDRYIVITTHMCTRSDYIRGLQAIELVELARELAATYNAPVMIGGDFNGDHDDANYQLFVSEEVGFTDFAEDSVAQYYNSDVLSHHGNMDEQVVHTEPKYSSLIPSLQTGTTEYKLILAGGGESTDGTRYSSNSIDRIYATNDSKLVVNVYGVVVDECTRAGSDHYPVFADFYLSDYKEYTKNY